MRLSCCDGLIGFGEVGLCCVVLLCVALCCIVLCCVWIAFGLSRGQTNLFYKIRSYLI